MIHLELQPDLESLIARDATSRGLTTESYIERILSAYSSVDLELQEGLEDIAAGRTVSARAFFAELHEEYGIRG